MVDARMGPGLKSIHKFKNRLNKNSCTSKDSESNSCTPVATIPQMPTGSLLDAASKRLLEISTMDSASTLAMLAHGDTECLTPSIAENRFDRRVDKGMMH